MAEMQTIKARHGTATYVPNGQVIKIINTSGTQVVDCWAFALPAPDGKKGSGLPIEETKQDNAEPKQKQTSTPKATPKKKKGNDLPSQEDAEKATQDGLAQGGDTPKKSTWGSYVPTSYVPSLGLGGGKKADESDEPGIKGETEQQKNSRTWASYFTVGQGFSSYIPKQATDTVSAFASTHQRDTNKTYLEQLTDFSKTPVGAAGVKAMTGSGYSGSLYAGYQAWNAKNAANAPNMEFMSMAHTHQMTAHISPKVNDSLVTNTRESILTLIEDTSPGVHDTLVAACDPIRYKGLGVDHWEEHGSCAENLVLALKELNERAGLKGANAVGADVTINNCPPPLNLFMNVPWDQQGNISYLAPKCKAGDYVRFRAERDVVVVMSACPQDILDTNAKNPTDAEFIVEDSEEPKAAIERTAPKKKVPPRKVSTQKTPSTADTATSNGDAKPKSAPPKKKPPPPRAPPPQKKPPGTAPTQPATKASQPVKKTTAQPAKTAPQSAQKPAPSAVKSMKKPIPPSVSNSASGESVPEKKKPRKIVRPQATAGAES